MRLLLAAGIVVFAGIVAVMFWPAPAGPSQPMHRMPGAMLPVNGPLRIVILGTSLTLRGAWRDELAASLTTCAARPVEVVPVAKPGQGSDWGLAQMDRVIALQPALVLIEFSVNDADLGENTSLAEARKNHEAILDTLKQAVPVLMTMSPAFGPRGWLRPRLGDYDAQYRELAEERRAGLIDIAPIWQQTLTAGNRRALMPDGLHPTDAAMTQVALPVIRAELGRLIPGCN